MQTFQMRFNFNNAGVVYKVTVCYKVFQETEISEKDAKPNKMCHCERQQMAPA